MKKNQQTLGLCLVGIVVLPCCSTTMVQDFAPESVAGKRICLDDTATQIQDSPAGANQWTEWRRFEGGCVFQFSFGADNQCRMPHSPNEATCLTYTKTGPTTAEIQCESPENAHTCYLMFDTPTTGTATKEGYVAEKDFKQRLIQFTIK